mgnify:CR=1 FL=1
MGIIMTSAEITSQTDLHHLYHQHQFWLQSWLGRKLGNHFDAADIAQDTFVRLITGRRSSYHLGNEPRALLTHIARCLVIDHWRRKDIERAYLDTIAHLPEQEVPSPESGLLIIEALQRIDAMLRDLPELTRKIFLLAQLEQLKYADIAVQTSVSLPTVKRHMRKAFLACLMLDES